MYVGRPNLKKSISMEKVKRKVQKVVEAER